MRSFKKKKHLFCFRLIREAEKEEMIKNRVRSRQELADKGL